MGGTSGRKFGIATTGGLQTLRLLHLLHLSRATNAMLHLCYSSRIFIYPILLTYPS